MDERQTIYLAGGCFWGVEEVFRQIRGVVSTQAGYANGNLHDGVTYKRVCIGDTDFREAVRVEYDPSVVTLEDLLWAYFIIIDPTLRNQQGNDRGSQYQTGIYWEPTCTELGAQIRRITHEIRRRHETQALPFCVEVHELSCFFPAEEYHQQYLVKNPGGYCHVTRSEISTVLSRLA